MKPTLVQSAKYLGLVLSAALLPTMIGCMPGSGRASVAVHSSSGYSSTNVMLSDDYMYYPDYEVYYSNVRHQYIYRDGRNWLTRPTPPRVDIGVLLASPSVRLDFQVSPEQHHSTVVKSYPRNWRPPVVNREPPKDNRKGDDRNRGPEDKRSDDDRRKDSDAKGNDQNRGRKD